MRQQEYWKIRVCFLLLILLLSSSKTQYVPTKLGSHDTENLEKEMRPESPPQPYPYALSSTYLIYLARTEMKIYKEIGKFAKVVKKRMVIIRAYLKDYEDSCIKAPSQMFKNSDPFENAAVIAGHPILIHRLISRLAIQFADIRENLSQNTETKLDERIRELSGVFSLPSKEDLQEATEAILRVHYTYNLNLEEFARGNMVGVRTKVGLTPDQTYKIGEYAAKMEYYSLAMDWFKVTQSKMNGNRDTHSLVGPLKLARSIKSNMEKHDKFFKRNKINSHWYMFTERLFKNPDAATLRSVNYEKLKGVNKSVHKESHHYSQLALCTGENLQTAKQMARMKCWYDKRDAYFNLFPLKAELLHEEPLLIQFHDVISDEWCREMIRAAMPSLQRYDRRVEDGTVRTATYAYLRDDELPSSVPISRRIELITGLNVRGTLASQDLQIASYAFGGHVSPHLDSIGEGNVHDSSNQLKGDWAAIFLAYLNDVENGGLTAFPALGVHVKPIKGSAVLWYGTLKNGQVDRRFMHVACPLVMGHKWIATKRVHLHKNFHTRPCDLDPNL